MERALTVSWSDPHAAFEAGSKLTPIEHLRAIRDGRIAEGRLEDAAGKLYAHGTSTCLLLG